MRQHRRSAMMIGRLHFSLVVLVVAVFSGCATLPPGSNFPKIASSALAHPEETRLGRPEPAVRNHTNVLRR
jgi:cardiolipin synthase C